ncbi:TlpA family protein disulfide reductase [Henriciella aquimarina]|uniref:TlpA family protein disulfide reductase n=1 Tax=Henriciella aquimarina TaxID=545261 RepID=UPI0009FF5ED2|nr:TlpA disulfide reductase family protein [Henriciella aquimarina]
MIRTLIATSALALITACGGGDTTNTEKATGFITPETPVPASAETEPGDVPRDDYGRPFTYEYLGKPIPDFSGTMVAGPLFSTQELKNQWTVIEVWGLWCSDCMADAPYVAALASAIAQDPDLAFLSIHTPPSAKRVDEAYGRYGSVEAYFEEKGYSFPTLLDPDASIRKTLSIRWTPSYLIVAPDRTVQGFRSELSAAENGEPVKDFLKDIAEVKREYNAAQDEAPEEDNT